MPGSSARVRFARAARLAAVAVVAAATGVRAQAPGPDLNDLALDWARGRYLSPVICSIGDELVRGGRRVLIAPGPRYAVPPVAEVRFSDLEVPDASRCFNDLGGEEPNVIGSLQLRLHGRSAPDTAVRDFKAALRRRDGFEFHVPAGHLRVAVVGEDAEGREVDLRGGSARLVLVERGSDEFKMLGDLAGMRRMLLEIEARDGTRLRFPLLMTEAR